MGFFYRGRHRAPTSTSTRLATVVVTGAAAVPLFGGVANAETPIDLGQIAACESSGDPQASNGSHFGLFQFDLSTWASVGGTGNPMNASVAEQYQRAQALYAARGTQPWTASQSCWAGRHGAPSVTARAQVHVQAPRPVQKPAQKVKPAPAKPSWAAAAARPHGNYTVKAGDTLSGISKDWRKLYEANRAVIGDNPHLIFPGEQLQT